MIKIARSLSLLALSAATIAAHAAPTLNLFTPNVTIVRPASGTVTYDFLGTVTSAANPIQYSNAGTFVVNPTAFDFLPADVYNDVNGTSTYTGRLFSVTVAFDSSLGLYDAGFESPQSTFFVSDGPDFAEVPFSVNVVAQPTPEPATLAAVGLGAAAMLRRRRRA